MTSLFIDLTEEDDEETTFPNDTEQEEGKEQPSARPDVAASSVDAEQPTKSSVRPEIVNRKNANTEKTDREAVGPTKNPRSAARSDQETTRKNILTLTQTAALLDLIKKISKTWAEQESTVEKTVRSTDIISDDSLREIAFRIPVSLQELKEIKSLKKKTIQDHGDRLIKLVRMFLESHGLEEHLGLTTSPQRDPDDGEVSVGGNIASSKSSSKHHAEKVSDGGDVVSSKASSKHNDEKVSDGDNLASSKASSKQPDSQGTNSLRSGHSANVARSVKAKSATSMKTAPPSQQPQKDRPKISHALLAGDGLASRNKAPAQPANAPPDTDAAHVPQDPIFRTDKILTPIEMELAWLGEESMHCSFDMSGFDFDFIWEFATESLKVELRKLPFEASEAEKLRLLVRMDDWFVSRRFEIVREQIRAALGRGCRREMMAQVIAERRLLRRRGGSKRATSSKKKSNKA